MDKFKSLTEYLDNISYIPPEGFCTNYIEQINILKKYASIENVTNIMEIGFNCGHSSELFLSCKENNVVTSFTVYNKAFINGFKYMDYKYNDRLNMVLGDSTKTVLDYHNKNPDKKFDLIFIDGAHWDPLPMLDLKNCKLLAHENTIILFDDTCYREEWVKYWNKSPTKAWTDALTNNFITEIDRIDFGPGRGMTLGKYNFNKEVE